MHLLMTYTEMNNITIDQYKKCNASMLIDNVQLVE